MGTLAVEVEAGAVVDSGTIAGADSWAADSVGAVQAAGDTCPAGRRARSDPFKVSAAEDPVICWSSCWFVCRFLID
jgi:hypothetical protein